MPKTYKISTENVEEIKTTRKTIKDKNTDKRLYAVQLRGEGLTNQEIANKLDTSDQMVSHWVSVYAKGGIDALLSKKRTGNHRNLSVEEEKKLLADFTKQSESGQLIDLNELKSAYIKKVGHSIGGSQIYRVLKRHGWRKVMPRSKHPKKANDEAIEASKKLKLK